MHCLVIETLMNRWKTYQQLFVLVIGIMIVPALFSYSTTETAAKAGLEMERIKGEQLEVILLWNSETRQAYLSTEASDASGVEIRASSLEGKVLLSDWVSGRYLSDYPLNLSAYAGEDVFLVEIVHGEAVQSSMLIAKK